MAKIDPEFPHDVYKFLISSIRKEDKSGILERWFAGPQRVFEETQSKILSLKDLHIPDKAQKEALPYLLQSFGFSNIPELSWAQDLEEAEQRKLYRNAVDLWKRKGTKPGLVDLLRVITGRTIIVKDWFSHRMIIDELSPYLSGNETDSWITGNLYTRSGAKLSFLLVNDQGVKEEERRLIYDLLSFNVGIGENYCVVYCAFVDEFENGIENWSNVGTESASLVGYSANVGSSSAGLRKGVAPVLEENKTAGWHRFKSTSIIQFFSTSALDYLEMQVVKQGTSSSDRGYYLTLQADGGWEFGGPGGVYATSTYTLPPLSGGTTGNFAIEIEAVQVNDATTEVSAKIEGRTVFTETLIGGDYELNSGGCAIYGGINCPNNILIHGLTILATPNRSQFVGQKPTVLQNYFAEPEPGQEPFQG